LERENTDKDEDRTNDHHATQAVKDLANSVDHVADEASFSVSFSHVSKNLFGVVCSHWLKTGFSPNLPMKSAVNKKKKNRISTKFKIT